MSEWKAARVGDICKAANGRAFKPTEWDTEGAPIIRIQNLKNDRAPFNYFRGEIEPRFRVQQGDLLFAWSGTPGTSFGAHIWRGGDAVLNQHIFNLHFDRKRIDERFFCYALNRNVADYVAKAQGGVGLAHITKGKFEESFVPLPDIDEQRAVVAELEKQFSRLDEAVAGLQRVKANLKRYKAAVLKSAVAGRLVPTEADLARREGRNYETGTQLLQRILETRRSQWQGKKSYQEPAEPRDEWVHSVPDGWAVATLESVTSANRVICYGILMPKENVADGVLFVKVRDIKNDKVVIESLHRTTQAIAASYARASLRAGDLLLSIRGTFGRVATVPPILDGGNITQDTVRLDVSPLVNADYVALFLRSDHAQRYFKAVARGVAVKGVNVGDLRPMAVPLPPVAEQHRIVAEVERLLSIASEVEAEVDANLKRAQGLRQAILCRAFASEPVGFSRKDCA